MVIKTKNKIIMHNEYNMFLSVLCRYKTTDGCVWTNTDLGGMCTKHN